MQGLLKIATETYDNMQLAKVAIETSNNDVALFHCNEMIRKQVEYIEYLRGELKNEPSSTKNDR